jgi:hypothetical protein
MENLTIGQIKVLAQQFSSPSISIFLPTNRAGRDTQEDPIRFKNLLREAEKQLLDSGLGPREVEALLKPAQELTDQVYFWKHQYEGLAVFLAPGDFHSYRLPFSVAEQMVISGSYIISPVLPLFTKNGHFFILALSQDEVRLFEGTRQCVGQIDLPEGTPESLDEALQLDDPQRQTQFHTRTSQGGTRDGSFHGQGPGIEENKVWIDQFLNRVDAGLEEIFREHDAPLVLAGVDYLLPIYRKVSDYKNIMEAGITGGPEHFRPEELQEQAWPIVEAYFLQDLEKTIEQYQQNANTDKASDQVEEIVAAAFNGRVDQLILSVDTQVWGVFNPDTGKVTTDPQGQSHPDHLSLLDFAAMKTLENGGTFYALSQEEMPTDSPIAAVFRY